MYCYRMKVLWIYVDRIVDYNMLKYNFVHYGVTLMSSIRKASMLSPRKTIQKRKRVNRDTGKQRLRDPRLVGTKRECLLTRAVL